MAGLIIPVLVALGLAHSQPPRATQIRAHVRATPDSAYRLLTHVLEERGYAVRDRPTRALTTSDRYVAGAGMVRLYATVVSDSAGAVIELSGEWRRLHRLLIFSAVAKDSLVITYGAGGSRGSQAWTELAAIGDELRSDGIAYGAGIHP